MIISVTGQGVNCVEVVAIILFFEGKIGWSLL